ncbi:aldehyde dehydrogenase domain-containing protein [Ilyonectria destructans]|nr:aldehyde dehydrogenase domain-containing protein [Ilyonectria destructans]
MALHKNGLLQANCAFIDGKWLQVKDGSSFDVLDPATWTPIAAVPDLTQAECIDAVQSADRALHKLSSMTGKIRGQLLREWFRLVMQAKNDLADIITAENGKTISEARGEVSYAADFIDWYAGAAPRVQGTVIESSDPTKRVLVIKQPVGVVGIITPWNFPAAMITRKVAAALAAGCPCVVKPAPETPLTALALASLAAQAGFPPGSLNIVTTQAHTIDIGRVLTQHPIIRKFSFTGSTAVGKLLAIQCTTTMKRVSLELGGNAPFVVFNDADLEAAAEAIMASKFRLSGQTCVCANRVYAQTGIYQELASILATKVQSLILGPGADAMTTIGPLITKTAIARVEGHVKDAVSKGAQVLVGGKRASGLGGAFFEPTLLVDVPADALCAQEETFGPVLPLFKFERDQDAINWANDTNFGLAGYLFTENVHKAWTVAEKMEVGMVGVNTGLISDVVSPFGGVKESGQGREGSYLGIEEFLIVKSISFAVKA